MSIKLVQLPTYRAECQDKSIELLEGMIEKVRAGQVNSVAIAATCPDSSSYTAHSPLTCVQTMVGALEILKLKMLTKD
jgi:hypothetical protein